jgi:hypothetical protein
VFTFDIISDKTYCKVVLSAQDDVRDCTTHLEAAEDTMEGATSKASLNAGLVPPAILNELSYQVMWRVAATQVSSF